MDKKKMIWYGAAFVVVAAATFFAWQSGIAAVVCPSCPACP